VGAAIAAAWLTALAVSAPPLAAQTCTGDCRGRGSVEISDLILAVNIVLGLASPEECPALGAVPGISQLIAAVNNALCACRPCGAATATETPIESVTPTSTEIATPTASPSPEPVVSMWREDMFMLASTDCPTQVNDDVRGQLEGAMFTYTIRQTGREAEIEDQEGHVTEAVVEADGTLRSTGTQQSVNGSCIVTDEFDHSVDLDESPATGTHIENLSTMRCTEMYDCRLRITTRWTRLDAAARTAR
jgi:hypothetical protein